MTITNQRIDITHSDADTMSIAKGVGAYSNASSSEIAFFLKGEWVVTPIEYFAKYHDGSPSDASTAVYGWVPNDLIESFLDDEVPDKIICIAPCLKCGARTASLTEAPTLCVHCDGHAYKTDRLMEGRFCEICDIEDYAHN